MRSKMKTRLTIAVVVLPGVLVGGFALWAVAKYILSTRRRLAIRRKKETVYLINTPEDWENVYQQLKQHTDDIKVVGLDCEWVFGSHPVALLQIATQQGLCLLVRLGKFSHRIPTSLKRFLADKSVLKVGVSVKDDGKKLFHDYGLVVQGCVDLRHCLTRVHGIYKCQSQSLKGLSEGILGVHLNKDEAVRCSNWEAEKLSAVQINYAAADAQVGVDIFVKLVLTKMLDGDPDRLTPVDGNSVSIGEFWKSARSMCQGLVDSAFRNTWRTRSPSHAECSKLSEKKRNSVDMARAYTARQRPLYHNCHLEAPDGQLLCTCDVRKAEWYIEKELGDKVCDDPLTVRLRFEPSGRPESEKNYYLQDKQNICVVCGASDIYIRKFIVPQEYRRYFPNVLKDHRSHDILLLCPPCHQVSSQCDAALRTSLTLECNAPLDAGSGSKSVQDVELQKIRGAAKALKLSKERIPEKRIKELEKVLHDHFGVDALTDDVIETAISMDIRIFNSQYVPHGKRVVEHFKAHGGLIAFEQRWRQQFIDTMKPQFLPPMWSVDHHF